MITWRSISLDTKVRLKTARVLEDMVARVLAEETAAFDFKQVEPAPIPATQLATEANAPVRQTSDLSAKTLAARFEPARVDTLGAAAYPAVETEPPRRSWLKAGIGLVLLAAVLAGGGLFVWKRGGRFRGGQTLLGNSINTAESAQGKTLP